MKTLFKLGFGAALVLGAMGQLKRATLWMAEQAYEAQNISYG